MNDSIGTRASGRGIHVLLIILVIAVLVVSIGRLLSEGGPSKQEMPNASQYQAVFLTNNQVYFGKLSFGKEHYILRDVYYIQTGRVPQPKEGDVKTETKLIKLGDEVHAPEDAMFISHESVAYWENIKDSGKVGEAIKQFKEKAKADAAKTTEPAKK